MVQKSVIFVFGMGRSGTSALTRVLSLCGASLPKVLLGISESNPRGHWEPVDALRLNNDFLIRHGATWYDPTLRLQGEVTFDDREQEKYVEKIRSFLEGCASGPLLVIKEPRIAALSDFWFEAARRASFDVKIVIPVRHPDEVASSLAARDRVSFELSSVLWLKYNLLAEIKSRCLPRVFVEYSNLLREWRNEIRRISEALSIELIDSNDEEIDAFIRDDLRRQKCLSRPTGIDGQPWIQSVYAAYSAAAKGEPLDRRALDEVFAAYRGCERAFRIAFREFDNRFGPRPRAFSWHARFGLR